MSDRRDTLLADPQRLAVLRESGLLDSPADEGFDRLTRLASRILGVPVALVSLVDKDRQFFKSCIGLPEPWASIRETPLSHSFCQYTVMTGEPLVVADAREHPELRYNRAVPDLGVIAYAGIPLLTAAGDALGTFCVIDSTPRQWSESDLDTLRDLAGAAATEIELRLSLARAHDAARELERLHRDRDEILDATTDGVYTIDTDGMLQLVNRAAAELLGYSSKEMLGLNAHRLFHHSRLDGTPYPQSECPIANASRSGRPVLVTDEVLWRKDGTPLPVSYASSPVWRDGRLVGSVVRFTDISEQRQAIAGLNLLAETGRLLTSSLNIDATLELVAELAVSSIADISVVDLIEGDTIRRLAASRPDTHLADLAHRLRQHPPRPNDGSPQASVVASGESLVMNDISEGWLDQVTRHPSHRETMREMAIQSLLIVPLRSRESVLGTLALIRTSSHRPFDNRDRDVAEELGRRAALAVENARLYDEARDATRARDDMLGVVSHDLRNPLNAIFMASSFLLEILPAEGRELEKKQIAVMRRAAERANRLIQDLLDIRRIERGGLALDSRSYPASLLVDEAIELARASVSGSNLRIERGRVDRGVHVMADRDRVLQALGNLLGNAIKFTPATGRITVSAVRLDDWVYFSVADTGSGIASENLPHLFERYWQVNRKDSRGVGLGLSIVKGIVDAHGGEVRVESTVGEGSVFTLKLPADRSVDESASRQTVREQPRSTASRVVGSHEAREAR
jgi:PAS domain S-box-containing protein